MALIKNIFDNCWLGEESVIEIVLIEEPHFLYLETRAGKRLFGAPLGAGQPLFSGPGGQVVQGHQTG